MKIRVIDDLSPENVAMLQALYSRSAESADVHLEKLQSSGSSRFMERYYVGYNHKSIGDCGSTTIFIENVSLLAAKAIQDWPLYSGQETSTRFIDMQRQPVICPDVPGGQKIIDAWMTFYKKGLAALGDHIRAQHPMLPADDPKKYDASVAARVFDIMRGFLPAGVATQLSWHTNLRQAGDHLAWLIRHPLSEVRAIAEAIYTTLSERYPNSGFSLDAELAEVSGAMGGEADRKAWRVAMADRVAYPGATLEGFGITQDKIALPYVDRLALKRRPRGAAVPHYMASAGQLTFEFLLDFGSFRDIQRHRNGVCRMPLLTVNSSHMPAFEQWYLDQLSPDLREEAERLLTAQCARIRRLPVELVERQPFIAIGFRVPVEVTYTLPAAIYVMEIRSGKTIHPTLRQADHRYMIKPFRERYPDIALHVDEDPDDWTVRRGGQTITERA
jgi:thymidylate synthase ThyX